MDQHACPVCNATHSDPKICPSCGARFGYRDGKGVVRGRNVVLVLMVLAAFASAGLLWLAANIPLWYYYYPLVTFGVLMLVGLLNFAFQLIRGPKWYPK